MDSFDGPYEQQKNFVRFPRISLTNILLLIFSDFVKDVHLAMTVPDLSSAVAIEAFESHRYSPFFRNQIQEHSLNATFVTQRSFSFEQQADQRKKFEIFSNVERMFRCPINLKINELSIVSVLSFKFL